MLFNSLSTIGFPKLVCPFTSAILKSPGFATWLTHSWKHTPRKHGIWMDASQKVVSSIHGFTLRLHVSFREAVSKSVKYQTSTRIDAYLAEVFQSKIAQIRRAHTEVSTMPWYQQNIRSVAWEHVATANVVVNSLSKHSKNTKCPPLITGSSNQGGQWQNTSVQGLKQLQYINLW